MFKKTNSGEADLLIKLLRIPLGTDTDYSIPQKIDWKEVVHLSYEQKVSALAVDGLKAVNYDPYKGLDDSKKEELKSILTPWFDDVIKTEESYVYYVEVLKLLCQIFVANGLTPIVLKGYGLNQNYPIPNHRGVGDIDVFLIDKDGKPAAEKGDELARNILHLEVTRIGGEHHSSFTFKGILIENHYELRGEFFKTDAEKHFLETLKELVKQDLIPVPDIEGAYFPSATFNALFMMRHMIGNLHHGLLNLRQLTDWVTFIKVQGQDIDWKNVDDIQQAAGLSRFAADLDGLSVKCFGLSLPKNVAANFDNKVIDHICGMIIHPITVSDSRLQIITSNYRNRWINKYFFNKSWLCLFVNSLLGVFKN